MPYSQRACGVRKLFRLRRDSEICDQREQRCYGANQNRSGRRSDIRAVQLNNMAKRILKIVKLTPIALSYCESCDAQFQSHQPVEDDAEAEMRILFKKHKCSDLRVRH